MRAGVIAVVLACAAASASGCGATPDDEARGPLTVYAGVPLRGPSAAAGRDIRDGAKLALDDAGGMAGEDEVELRVLDDAGPGGWTPGAVAAAARKASEDTSAIAYIGDFESGATRVSLPITNQAMVPQVSPASTGLDLATPGPDAGNEVPELVQPTGERTFVRVIGDDGTQAEAAAAWARRLGTRRVATLSDGSQFGDWVVEEFAEAAEGLGMEVVEATRPVAIARAHPELVYYGGEARGALPLLRAAADAAPDAILMSTDALLMDPEVLAGAGDLEPRLRVTASAESPEQLPAAGHDLAAAFRRRFGRRPGPYAAYGYEAMALVLDAIERARSEAGDRRAVLDELLATRERSSVLGTYSITAAGDTTLAAIAGYRIRDAEPVFDRPLAAR
jgi:branched-chain amino acid transport system substrate-binding protein